MQDIRFYTFDGTLVHIEHRVISANWTIYYNRVGTFEGEFSILGKMPAVVLDNKYLIIVQGDKQAIMTGRQIDLTMKVYGRTLNWLLTRRCVLPFSVNNKNIAQIVLDGLSSAFDAKDRISFVSELGGLQNVSSYSLERAVTAEDFARGRLDEVKAGHRIEFSKGDFVCKLYKGSEKSLVLSQGSRNVYNIRVGEDCLDYYNGGYIRRQDGTYELVSEDGEGLLRWYCLLDSEDDLSEKQWDKRFEAYARGLVCGEDYGLGDILKLQVLYTDSCYTVKVRVVGVSLWYENGSVGEQPILEEVE